MGYMVPFLTMSSILIDVCFTNVIFIGVMFNSYNYWYLLSYSNHFTLHYSMLFLISSIIIIGYFYYYINCKFWPSNSSMAKDRPLHNNQSAGLHRLSRPLHYSLIHCSYFNLIFMCFFSNFTFFIPIFLDFFLIFSMFFFKYMINSIEVFTGFNPCYSMFFYNFFSLFFYIQSIMSFYS